MAVVRALLGELQIRVEFADERKAGAAANIRRSFSHVTEPLHSGTRQPALLGCCLQNIQKANFPLSVTVLYLCLVVVGLVDANNAAACS